MGGKHASFLILTEQLLSYIPWSNKEFQNRQRAWNHPSKILYVFYLQAIGLFHFIYYILVFLHTIYYNKNCIVYTPCFMLYIVIGLFNTSR